MKYAEVVSVSGIPLPALLSLCTYMSIADNEGKVPAIVQ